MKTVSILQATLIHTGRGGVDAADVRPFVQFRAELGQQFGIDLDYLVAPDPEALRRQLPLASRHLIILHGRCLSGAPQNEQLNLFDAVRSACTRLVFLYERASPGNAPAHLLPNSDVFVMKSLLRAPESANRDYLDGRYAADRISRQHTPRHLFKHASLYFFTARHDAYSTARHLGRALHKWLRPQRFFPPRAFDADEHRSRMLHGWNVGISERLERGLFASDPPPPWSSRDIDIHCRVRARAGYYSDWYYFHRQAALHQLARAKGEYRIVATDKGVSGEVYLDELRRSRLVVSPFGWGEVCLRDFEAVNNGCLLIKPHMDHLETSPSIYEAGKTYVPVEWDFRGLREVCRRQLERPDESQRIIENARRAYRNYFELKSGLKRAEVILERVCDSPHPGGRAARS